MKNTIPLTLPGSCRCRNACRGPPPFPWHQYVVQEIEMQSPKTFPQFTHRGTLYSDNLPCSVQSDMFTLASYLPSTTKTNVVKCPIFLHSSQLYFPQLKINHRPYHHLDSFSRVPNSSARAVSLLDARIKIDSQTTYRFCYLVIETNGGHLQQVDAVLDPPTYSIHGLADENGN